MDWTQVQTVVRLWSLRPWLYNWEIASLELPDKKVDDRWLRWFHEVDMVKKNKKPGDMEELDDGEIDTIKKVYQIYTLLFGNQEDLKVKDLDEIKMLVYRTSTIGNWLNKLVLEAREMPAVRAWTEQLPLPEETDILLLVFVCYNYCILLKIVDRLDRGVTLRSLMFSESDEIKLKREEGNTAFKDGMYKVAVSFYTDALKQMTYNQKLYGNRAQAHLKMNNPRAAACDGMRCVYINPMWDKGWVRYSSGLLAMGRAVEAWQVIQAGIHMIPEPGELLTNHANDLKKNEEVAKYLMSEQVKKHPLLKMDPDGMTHKTSQTVGNIDSSSQTSSIDDMPELVSDGEDTITATKAKKSSSSRKTSSVPKNNSAAPKKEKSSAKKASDAKVPVMKNGTVKADIEKPRKSEKAVPVINNPMPVNINNNNMKKTNINIMQSKPTSHLSVEGSRARNLLASASAAWLEKRMRNSVTSYSEALGMLTPTIQKEIGYNDDQVAVVMYVLGLSYISIGTEKDVQDGLEHFSNILERFRHLVFPLAYLGIGMTYTKWNRFKMAIEPLSKGLRITKKHPLTQVYAWPETNVCIEESNKERLTTCLESMLIECHQPPKPHAICRYYDCNHYKIEIYLSDPDFKGYVELRCYAHCTITYHQDCWKKYKSASDKEILSGKCFTPNCVAPLSRILMYDHTGEVAIEKENKLPPKDPVQPKPSKKLKPSSQNTINKRIERKQRRKQKREEERQKKEEACKLDELLDTVESAPNNVELEQKAAPEVDLLTCTTINPKREEEEQRDQEAKKLKKKRRVQKEQRVVVRLDVMTPEMPPCVGAVSYDDEGQSLPTAGTFGGLDDFEEITGFPSLNPVTPFAVPSHLVADVSYFEDPMAESASSPTHHSIPSIPSRSASPAVSETAEREKEIFEANHRQAIRESLFQLFKGILQDSGPLHIDDSRITLELANFPSDTLNIIEAEGGIGGFLKKSINFTLIDDIVGLIKDSNKIRKVANKRKAQMRKSATNNRSKKGALDAIPSHLKPTTVTAAQPSTSSVPDNNFTFTVPAPVAKFAGDHESDRDSIISSDTACSEPCDIISNSSRNSSGRNKPLSFTSSSGGGVSGKSSPWQRHPSLSLENLQYTEAEPQSLDKAAYPPSPEEVPKVQMSNVEVLNAYRLGANHLRTAVDLGRLAKRVNVHLGVEVRLLYGWEHTTGLEELDTATVTEATTILQDALEVVTSSASVVYSTGNSTFGAEVYFFGLGQNSIDGEHGKWVPGPEVGFNNFIVIALLLDHVDIEQMTVEISQLDQASVETLRALNNAANTVRGIGDHFKGSIDIKTAILPVFSTMGRRVAVDDPETLALLAQSTQTHKSPPELAFNTASSIQSLSPLPSSPPALQSPIPQSPIARPLRPTSSGYSSPSHIQPLLSLNHLQNTMNPSQPAPPFSFSNPIASPPVSMSVPPLMSIPNQLFKPSFDGSSFRPSIWDSGHDETATGLLSDAYNYKGPQTAAEQNRKRQEDDLKAAVMQVNEYAVATEQLKERIAILEERLIATTNERDQCHVQQSTLLSLQQALHEKAQELSTCQVAAQQMQTNLTAKNQELVAQIENICRSTEVEMAKAEVQIDDYRSKAQREMSLRMATETQYQDVVRERDRALNEICTKHQDEKKRAENAEIAMLQLKLEVGLQIIDRSAKEAELFISKIQAGAKQYTDQFMAVPMEYKTAEEAWKTTLSRIKLTREMAVTSFEDQKTQVKNGIRLETLPTLDLPRPPPAPEMPQLRPAPSLIQPVMGNGDIGKMLPYDHLSHAATNGTASGPMSSSSSTTAYLSRPSQPLTAAAAVTPSVHSLKPQQPMTVATAVASQMSALHTAAKSRPPGFSAAAAAAPAPTSVRVTKSKNSFDRIVDQIQMKFPCFDRSKISAFLQQLRESRGGSLSGMKMENVLSNVERYIQRQYQPSLGATAGSGSSGSSMAALDPMTLETFMEEDPCTICLDELLPGSTQELDCRHRFHAACIRQWLREKSTCPNCNTHALLPDEFPVLGS